MCGDAHLYTGPEQVRSWMCHPLGRPPSISRCLLARNDKREGALRIYLVVSLALAARSSISGATGGEYGAFAIVE